MPNKNFAEFFAGIGLVHAALQTSGWKCIYANDIDPKKHEMYEHKFGKSDYYHVGDVWNTEEVVSKIESPIQLATASFPCVDLSLAGNRKGLAGKESGTFYGFTKVLESLRQSSSEPGCVLIENVMGFLTAHDGEDFSAACQELSKMGYWIDSFTVDAKYFTPQSRPRLFIVGCLEEHLPARAIKHKSGDALSQWTQHTQHQEQLRTSKLISSLLELDLNTGLFSLPVENLPAENRNIQNIIDLFDGDWWADDKVKKHLSEMSEAHLETLNRLSRNKMCTSGTMYRRVRRGRSRTEIRTDGLAGCLRTPRGGSSKQMVFVAGQGEIKMRWMLPKEYAALQGVPDFPLSVGTTQALFGFGDAVCVPAVEWITQNYLEPIFESMNNDVEVIGEVAIA